MALYVTDTHPLIWYGSRNPKLSKTALRIFNRAERGEALIYIPAMILLECGILARMGRIRLKDRFAFWATALLSQPGFEYVPLEAEVVTAAVDLQIINDPFDLSAIATARLKGLPLITADQEIIDSKLVEIVW